MGGQVLKAAERWVGPFQIRRLLESCLDPSAARPPETGSAYLVTKFGWQGQHIRESTLTNQVSRACFGVRSDVRLRYPASD